MTHGNGPGGVLIFGAYGGVGSALARRLRNEGFELALSGRDQAKLGALAAEVDALPLCVRRPPALPCLERSSTSAPLRAWRTVRAA